MSEPTLTLPATAPHAVATTLELAAKHAGQADEQSRLIALASAMLAYQPDVDEPPTVDPEPSPEPEPQGAKYPYLEDQPASRVQRTLMAPWPVGWPKISTGSLKTTALSAQELALFDSVEAKVYSFNLIAKAQGINPDLVWKRILCPQEYQGWTEAPGRTGAGIPFDSTGAVTDGKGQVFPGHWLYKPGSTLTADASDTASSVAVAHPSRFEVGQYVTIHNGAWGNAENARIDDIDGNTVTLSNRGHKSSALAHPAGSVIAMHQRGNTSHPEGWAWNLSIACPVDAGGRQINAIMAEHHAATYDVTTRGEQMTAKVSGILADSDFLRFIAGGSVAERSCDCDNDGNADGGMLPDGTNAWGAGLLGYYRMVREALDARGAPHDEVAHYIGDAHTISLEGSSSGQHEGFIWHIYPETGHEDGKVGYVSEYVSWLHANLLSPVGPLIGNCQNKARCASYYAGENAPADDSSHRLVSAIATIYEQETSHQNGYGPALHWFDFYRVCIANDDPAYQFGDAIPSSDHAACMRYRGWLGEPVSDIHRVYGEAFRPDHAVWQNDCATLDGVTGNGGVSVELGNADVMHWRAVTGKPAGFRTGSTGLRVRTSALSPGWHTLTFATRSDIPREVSVSCAGSVANRLAIPGGEKWVRQVYAFEVKRSGLKDIAISSGGDGAAFDLADLRIHRGDANVWIREYERGIVVANATSEPKTIALGGIYQMIRGTQDAQYDGRAGLESITLPPFDAAFLLRSA